MFSSMLIKAITVYIIIICCNQSKVASQTCTLADITRGITTKDTIPHEKIEVVVGTRSYHLRLDQSNRRQKLEQIATSVFTRGALEDVMLTRQTQSYYGFLANGGYCVFRGVCDALSGQNNTIFSGLGLVVKVLSATQLSDDSYLMNTVETDRSYKQTVLNSDSSLNRSISHGTGVSKIPDSMTWIGKDNETGLDEIYAFFGPFGGYYLFNLTANQPLTLDPSNDHTQIHNWVGCPANLCFDADLDAASFVTGRIYLFRGRYVSSLTSLTATSALFTEQLIWNALNSSNAYVDAAFGYFGLIYLIQDNSTKLAAAEPTDFFSSPRDDQSARPQVLFNPTLDFSTLNNVDAAYNLNNVIYFISNKQLHEYTPSRVGAGLQLKFVQSSPLSTKWSGLPKNIDAALHFNGMVYLFSGNFFFKADPIQPSQLAPDLIQRTLFACPDARYAHPSFKTYLNISNFSDYRNYRLRCCLPKDDLVPTPATPGTPATQVTPVTPVTQVTQFKTVDKKSANTLTILAVVCCVLSVILVGAVINLLNTRNSKGITHGFEAYDTLEGLSENGSIGETVTTGEENLAPKDVVSKFSRLNQSNAKQV